MKIAVLISRILLGLVFVAAGVMKIFPLVPMKLPPGDAGAMMQLMMTHKWLLFYGLVETAGGLMLLIGRFVPLGLTLIAAVGVNITLFNLTLQPSALPIALLLAALELFLVYAYRASFAGIFSARSQPAR